jgi:integrase
MLIGMATRTHKKTARRAWGHVRRLPSGYVQASYVHDDGRRYTAPHTFSATMDAEGWLRDERKLIDRGEWTPPQGRAEVKAMAGVTLAEFAEGWLPQRDLTPKTRALYRALLKGRILPVLGDEPLRGLTPAQVRVWWAGLQKDTPTRNTHAYQLLKAIYNTALQDNLVTENPCQIKSAGKPPKARDVQPLTPAELVKVAEKVPETYRAAVAVAAWCGLRFGELIELRRKDIHTSGDRMVLKIRRAATIVHNPTATALHNQLVVGAPKTDAGVRDVTVPPHVAQLLRAHMKAHTGAGQESFVFTTTRGKRLSQTAFTKSVKNGFASVGKPDMRVHDLRHIGATLAAQAGATTKELMSRIGHTTPAMAMRYQIAAQERDAAIADKLSELAIAGKPTGAVRITG